MIDKDFHFELLPSPDAANGAAFGIGLDVGLDDAGFHPGPDEWQAQDSTNPITATTAFGRDRLTGPEWAWDLHVNRKTSAEAIATKRAFHTAWRWSHGRNTPGMVTALRFQLEGERRRVYGRPRVFDAPPDNRVLGGYIPMQVTFKCFDGLVYDDVETGVTLLLGKGLEEEGADTGGGFVFPVIFPVVTLPPTKQVEQFRVGGTQPAAPVIRFYGPVTGPGLVADDWEVRFKPDYTIPDGHYVDVDLRPWAMTVLYDGVTNASMFLRPRQRLLDVAFEPGRFEAKYVGFSSGVSSCQVRWASTYDGY